MWTAKGRPDCGFNPADPGTEVPAVPQQVHPCRNIGNVPTRPARNAYIGGIIPKNRLSFIPRAA
jgi:hypothetical protein